jgi:hypothetical protein
MIYNIHQHWPQAIGEALRDAESSNHWRLTLYIFVVQ